MKKMVLLILAVLFLSQFSYSTNKTTNGLTELFKQNGIREVLHPYFTYEDLCALFGTCTDINLSISKTEWTKQKENLLKELFVSDFKEYRKFASFDRSGLAHLTLEIPMYILNQIKFQSFGLDWPIKKKRRKNIESTFNGFDFNDLVDDSLFITIEDEGEYHQINVENGYEGDIFNQVESNYYGPMSEEEIYEYWYPDDPHDLEFHKLKPQEFLKIKFIVNFDDKLERDYLQLFDKGFLFEKFKFSIYNKNERFTIPNTEEPRYEDYFEFLPDVDLLEQLGVKFQFTFYEKQITTTEDGKKQIDYGFTNKNDEFKIHHTSVEKIFDLQSQLDEEKEEKETNQNNFSYQMYSNNPFFNPMHMRQHPSFYNTPKFPQCFQHPSQIQNPIFQQQIHYLHLINSQHNAINKMPHHCNENFSQYLHPSQIQNSFFQQQNNFLMNIPSHLMNSQHDTINNIPSDLNQNFAEYESYISDSHGSEDNYNFENKGDDNSEYDLENMSTYVFHDNEEASELDISEYKHLSRNQSDENKSENQDNEEDNTSEIDLSEYDHLKGNQIHQNIFPQNLNKDLQKSSSSRETKY